jgi:integrase
VSLRFPRQSGLLLTVTDVGTGQVIMSISLGGAAALGHAGGMPTSLATGAGKDARAETRAVAGRIEGAKSDLQLALDDWLKYLGARGKRPSTITVYRSDVTAAARDAGWESCLDLTFAAVTSYLADQRERRGWRNTTYNRHLTVWRSFCRWLERSKRIERSPLELESNLPDDGGDGSRAATTDEARRLVATALSQAEDRRSKGDRALVWACMFLAGLRSDEPGRWRREHLVLEHEVPHVAWTEDIQKNRRKQRVALHPQLVELLRRHLAVGDEARRQAGQPPATPTDPVFAFDPPRTTFRKDRDRAGIAAVDERGRRFSPHSARKWLETEAIRSGVHPRVIDHLMRHSTGTPGRYVDLTLSEQRLAISRLPGVWPGLVHNPGDQASDLTRGAASGTHGPATTMSSASTIASLTPGLPSSAWSSQIICDAGSGSASLMLGSVDPAPAGGQTPVEATRFLPGNAEGRTRTADLRVMNPAL